MTLSEKHPNLTNSTIDFINQSKRIYTFNSTTLPDKELEIKATKLFWGLNIFAFLGVVMLIIMVAGVGFIIFIVALIIYLNKKKTFHK